jgi:hypothetical protein
MRHIDPNTWQDEFFGTQLNVTERLIWLGLIASVADDQGRMLDNTALLRSLIFPYDDGLGLDVISGAIEKLAIASKIHRYQANGKSLLQIVNWWKYQSSASWMSPSKYPPPEGWQDCFRYHTAGNELVTSPNWKKRAGGFVPPTPLPSPLPRSDVNDDVDDKDDDEQKMKPDRQAPPTSPSSSRSQKGKTDQTSTDQAGSLSARRELCRLLQTTELPSGWESAVETYTGLRLAHGEIIEEATQMVLFHWTRTRRKNGSGTYSKLSPGWMDWLVAYLAGEKPWEVIPTETRLDFTDQLVAAGYSMGGRAK